MSDISKTGSDFVRDLGDAARKNPLSAALIGMGITWLIIGGRPAARAREFMHGTGIDRIPEAASDEFESVRSSFRSGRRSLDDGGSASTAAARLRKSGATVLDRASRVGADTANAVSDYAGGVSEVSRAAFKTARSGLVELFKAQPLALGAVGLAIGAGIAAALPATDVETAYLGEASNAVKEKAADFAEEQTSRATAVAGNVLNTATEEARKQGLTLDDAKSAASEFSERIARVVKAAAHPATK